jgi:hypothetical protein
MPDRWFDRLRLFKKTKSNEHERLKGSYMGRIVKKQQDMETITSKPAPE